MRRVELLDVDTDYSDARSQGADSTMGSRPVRDQRIFFVMREFERLAGLPLGSQLGRLSRCLHLGI